MWVTVNLLAKVESGKRKDKERIEKRERIIYIRLVYKKFLLLMYYVVYI